MSVPFSKDPEYYENLNLSTFMDTSQFRIGQQGAINCIIESIMEGNHAISIVLPTRYGKSDVIRASAIELIDRGLASYALMVTPAQFLRDHLISYDKLEEMIERYKIRPQKPLHYDVLENFRPNLVPNDEYFISLTTQMLALHADKICKQVKALFRKTKKRIIIFIDEAHTASEGNTWGNAAEKLVEAGAIVVLLTATPYREDGYKIPNFNFTVMEEQEKTRHIPRNHDTPGKLWIDVYQDLEAKLRLVPDYEYTFRRAWEAGGVICKMNRIVIDVKVKIPDKREGLIEKYISEMSLSESSRYLGRVVRDNDVIYEGCKELSYRLRIFRNSSKRKSTQAIVFCGNDIDGEDDGHANQIKQILSTISPDLKIVIATSNQEDADLLIKKFAEGDGDILIVKQMASLGLDIPSIKFVLDLSAVRTLSSFIQRIMRAATLWNDIIVGHLITPYDVRGEALWNGFVQDNGGEITVHDSTLMDSYEVEETSREDSSGYFEVTEVSKSIQSDNNGLQVSSDDFDRYVKPVIEDSRGQALQSIMTDAEIASFIKDIEEGNLGATDAVIDNPADTNVENPVLIDVSEQRASLKIEINKLVKEIIKRNHKSVAPIDWGKTQKYWHTKYKKAVGVNPSTPLKNIGNLKKLQEIMEYLNKVICPYLSPKQAPTSTDDASPTIPTDNASPTIDPDEIWDSF